MKCSQTFGKSLAIVLLLAPLSQAQGQLIVEARGGITRTSDCACYDEWTTGPQVTAGATVGLRQDAWLVGASMDYTKNLLYQTLTIERTIIGPLSIIGGAGSVVYDNDVDWTLVAGLGMRFGALKVTARDLMTLTHVPGGASALSSPALTVGWVIEGAE